MARFYVIFFSLEIIPFLFVGTLSTLCSVRLYEYSRVASYSSLYDVLVNKLFFWLNPCGSAF